ncbi:unnamed protein product [Trichobilharzia regenti]|nr:unnamed protein product [Trichobilharzia regenti]
MYIYIYIYIYYYCYSFKLFFQQTWNDYHFLWNPKNFGNITTLILPYTAVWRPDILLYNCADEKFDRLFPTNTVINHNGTVQWLPPGLFKSTCNIDILWFPFDEQKCEMKFGSWTYNGDQVNFQLQCINASQPNCTEVGTVDLSEYSNNGEFHLRGKVICFSVCVCKCVCVCVCVCEVGQSEENWICAL